MPGNCAAHRSSPHRNVELRDVDQHGAYSAQTDHGSYASGSWHVCRYRVGPGHEAQKQQTADGRLIVEQLESIDLESSLVGGDPHQVNSADQDTPKSEDHPEDVSRMRFCRGSRRFGLETAGDCHAQTHRY